jgi:hypothetical protein
MPELTGRQWRSIGTALAVLSLLTVSIAVGSPATIRAHVAHTVTVAVEFPHHSAGALIRSHPASSSTPYWPTVLTIVALASLVAVALVARRKQLAAIAQTQQRPPHGRSPPRRRVS